MRAHDTVCRKQHRISSVYSTIILIPINEKGVPLPMLANCCNYGKMCLIETTAPITPKDINWLVVPCTKPGQRKLDKLSPDWLKAAQRQFLPLSPTRHNGKLTSIKARPDPTYCQGLSPPAPPPTLRASEGGGAIS